MPSIAVLTASRNAASTLPALFETLKSQSLRDFEWIVVDGASTDGSVTLLNRFAREFDWVKWTSERDFGLYDALNKGLRRIQAPLYVVVGADDRLAPDALANYVALARSSGADVILADVSIEGQRRGGFKPGRGWLSHAAVFRGSHSVGMAIRTALHSRFGEYSSRFPLLADGLLLKTLVRAKDVRFFQADFIAGDFSRGGMTGRRKAQILAETWQIQLLTERHPVLQTLLFLGKLLLRMPAVVHEVHAEVHANRSRT